MIKGYKALILRLRVFKIVMLFALLFAGINTHAQGLQFNSNDSLLSKRTSYNVFKNSQPEFHDHLAIAFDLSLWDNEHLGYILNITDAKGNSYSLSSIYFNNAPYLNFNIDSKSNKINIPLKLSQLKKRNWMKIKLDIDLAKSTVGVFINNKWYRAGGFGFERLMAPKIFFGKNEHYFDVPKMAIRDLTISDSEKTYHFPLNEWAGNKVFSSENDDLGFVENPVWLINESYFWASKLTKNFKEVTGVNFDTASQKLLMFKSDSLFSYDVQRNFLSKQAYANPCPVPLHLGKSIINTKQNVLYAYETLKAPKPAPSIAALDLKTLTWATVGNGTIPEQRHHHNLFYDADQNKFYLFGGYGSYAYYKDFFTYNKQADSWDKVAFTGDNINPRFFSGYSSADDNNNVYIFGGYGNQSGEQVVGGRHFYDLNCVNLSNHSIKKCWEIKSPAEDFVAANNLIISKDKKYFYAICYAHDKPKTSLRLYKFSIKDGSYEIVSGVIPAKGERIESDINLFYNQQQETFYCAIQEFTTPDYSTVRLYSLASPPVKEADYIASQTGKSAPNKSSEYIYSIAVIVAILSFGLGYLKRSKDKSKVIISTEDQDAAVTGAPAKTDARLNNAVYLLGEFTVYDKSSRDITYLFSPKIRQLFILILLNSKDECGVTSKKISATLWPDKDIAKTKNIKGVTINHLRNIINDINGLELTFVNDTYCFKLDDILFCDYFLVTDTIKHLNAFGKASAESILDIFTTISRGDLLQYISEPWLDDVKVNYEESVVTHIQPEIKRIYEEADYKKTIDITRFVLTIDPFNDTAIKYKLKSIRRIKGIEHARKQYEEFAAEYEKSLGVQYTVPFEKICTAK